MRYVQHYRYSTYLNRSMYIHVQNTYMYLLIWTLELHICTYMYVLCVDSVVDMYANMHVLLPYSMYHDIMYVHYC